MCFENLLQEIIEAPFEREIIKMYRHVVSAGTLAYSILQKKYRISYCIEVQSSFLEYSDGKTEFQELEGLIQRARA